MHGDPWTLSSIIITPLHGHSAPNVCVPCLCVCVFVCLCALWAKVQSTRGGGARARDCSRHYGQAKEIEKKAWIFAFFDRKIETSLAAIASC